LLDAIFNGKSEEKKKKLHKEKCKFKVRLPKEIRLTNDFIPKRKIED